MKFPTTPEEIVHEIYIASDKYSNYGDLRIRQLIYVLRNVADDVIVEAVIQVIEGTARPNTSFLDQEFAGRILEEIKPSTSALPEKLIERCLINWNKSVEQFPFWLVEVFGMKSIEDALGATEDKVVSEIEKKNIITMRWWLRALKPR